MFNCFYSLFPFGSDILDLLICIFDAYFIKLFRIRISYIAGHYFLRFLIAYSIICTYLNVAFLLPFQ